MPQPTANPSKVILQPPCLKQIDLFRMPVPTFTLNGRSAVRSYVGGMMTLVILYTTFLFCTLKLKHLLTRHNPTVNSYEVSIDSFDDQVSKFNTSDDGFMMAFAIDSDNGLKQDPRFIKWVARYIQIIDGETVVRNILLQPCTEEDMQKFNPPDSNSVVWLERH